jgi:dienelactone hydrolase
VTGVVREEAPGRRVNGPRFKAAIAYYPGCERPLRAQRLGMPVETILYPEAHHGFDASNSPLRLLLDVYNPKVPGERGAHVGTHERARLQAMADTKRFLDQQLAR